MASQNTACGPNNSSTNSVSSVDSSPQQITSPNGCEPDLQVEYQTLQARDKSLIAELDQLDLKMKYLQLSTCQLQDKHRAAYQENQDLVKDIAGIEKSNKDLQAKTLCHKSSVNKYSQMVKQLKDKLKSEDDKLAELQKTLQKCIEEHALQLQEKQQQFDAAMAENKQLKKDIVLQKEKLERLCKENQHNKNEYEKAKGQITEAECQLKQLEDEVDTLKEQLSQLKCELDQASQEYQKLEEEHCEIKDSMLQQEAERQEAFDLFSAQQSKQEKLEEKIRSLTIEKERLSEDYEKTTKQSEDLQKKISAKERKLEELVSKISEVATKQSCVTKKIQKAEKLIKHLVSNQGRGGC